MVRSRIRISAAGSGGVKMTTDSGVVSVRSATNQQKDEQTTLIALPIDPGTRAFVD